MIPYDKSLVKNAQTLRKNMTPEERKLWYVLLRRLPYTVKRQHNIENYIVDFYIPSKKVVIEIDGAQHGRDEDRSADQVRDAILSKYGITVLRYTNNDINRYFSEVSVHLLNRLGTGFDELKELK